MANNDDRSELALALERGKVPPMLKLFIGLAMQDQTVLSEADVDVVREQLRSLGKNAPRPRKPRDGFFSDLGPVQSAHLCPMCSVPLWIDNGYRCRSCKGVFTAEMILGSSPSSACKQGMHDHCSFDGATCACQCHV